jgi:hypothetical protein
LILPAARALSLKIKEMNRTNLSRVEVHGHYGSPDMMRYKENKLKEREVMRNLRDRPEGIPRGLMPLYDPGKRKWSM